jgi:hypothetical protein
VKLIRILCAVALASLSAQASAQSNGGIGAAGMLSRPVDRVTVGQTAAPADIGTTPSAGLYEGRSVVVAKRRCWVNVYGDRQCEYR